MPSGLIESQMLIELFMILGVLKLLSGYNGTHLLSTRGKCNVMCFKLAQRTGGFVVLYCTLVMSCIVAHDSFLVRVLVVSSTLAEVCVVLAA